DAARGGARVIDIRIRGHAGNRDHTVADRPDVPELELLVEVRCERRRGLRAQEAADGRGGEREQGNAERAADDHMSLRVWTRRLYTNSTYCSRGPTPAR